MRVNLLLLVLSFYAGCLFAQSPYSNNANRTSTMRTCGTDVFLNTQRQQPGFSLREQQMNNTILQHLHNRGGGALTIPVVVHVIYNDQAFSNISDQVVRLAIQQLNEDFNNSDIPIQFCLAQQDPNGNYTTGINHLYSALADVNIDTQDQDLKDLIRWDPLHYLNIWVVHSMVTLTQTSTVGYATFPTSHGNSNDGIVCEANFMGTPGTARSHVLTHEAGHYLGLYHTFEGGCNNLDCQNDGDRVCDTPPDYVYWIESCDTTYDSCENDEEDTSPNNPFRAVALGGLGNQTDDLTNYMDYGNLFCMDHFTYGQSERMYLALTDIRTSLLGTDGCNSPCPTPVNTEFFASVDTATVGTPVFFFIGNPNANYTWYINGVNSGSSSPLTYTFNTAGRYTIRLEGENGINCFSADSMIMVVKCSAVAKFTVNNGPYPTGGTITATNTSTNATLYQWFKDGVWQTTITTANFSQQNLYPGGHNLYLIASNSQCSDTSSTVFYTVGNCVENGPTNNWAVTHRRMNFSSSPPIITPTSNIIQWQESNSVMSDNNGNLLFYSSGDTIWDRNNNPMPNGTGLLGGESAMQGSLAVPMPGSITKYYIFTSPEQETIFDWGTRYTIVDMSLNNGLGDVVSGQKNILLLNHTGEKLTGTYHANGRDIWIIVADYLEYKLNAYLITPSGISSTPVTTTIGQVIYNGVGNIKFSPDGNKLVNTILNAQRVIMADFNKSTGEFFNVITFNPAQYLNYRYGETIALEFSSDNSKFYISTFSVILGEGSVIQYNLAAGSASDIIHSGTVIKMPEEDEIYFTMALGNDGLIYVTRDEPNHNLDYIISPNITGINCNFVANEIPGPNFKDLPNLFNGRVRPREMQILGPQFVCTGNNTHTYSVAALPGETVTWTYTGIGTLIQQGDTAILTGASSVSTNTLIATIFTACDVLRDTITIQVSNPGIPVSLGNDTLICNNLILSTENSYTSYLWNTGATTPTINITQPGTYWVEVHNTNTCTSKDSIVVSTWPAIEPIFITASPGYVVCNGSPVTLGTSPHYASYAWMGQPQNSDSTFVVNQGGLYFVNVSDGCHGLQSTVFISTHTIPPVTITSPATTMCNGQNIVLDAGSGYSSYQWQDNTTNQTLTATQPGTYWVTVHNSYCADTDSIIIAPATAIPPVTITGLTVLCNGQTTVLNAGSSYSSYQWQDNSINQTYTATQPGTYWVEVSNSCGTDIDSITIVGGNVSPFELMYNNDTIACKSLLPFTLNAPAGYAHYLWQNGDTTQSFNVLVIGTYYVTISDTAGCSSIDTFRVVDCTGINEDIEGTTLIYPNPAGNLLYIETSSNNNTQLKVYSITGQIVFSAQFTGKTIVPTDWLADGIYVAELISNKTIVRKKFSVIH